MKTHEKRPTPPGVIMLLIVTSLVVGYIVGVVYRGQGSTTIVTTEAAPLASPGLAQKVVVEAILHMPTGTPTEIPTIYPTPKSTLDTRADDCDRSSPQVGDICRQPPMPTNTPVPVPDCPTFAGDMCVWTGSPVNE